MRLLLAVAAAGVVMTTTAFAADPASGPYFDWAGLYVGLNAGYGSADTTWTFPFAEYYNLAPGDGFSTSPAGGLAGAHIGYNHQFGSWVAGLEASVSAAGLTETLTGPVTPVFPLDALTTKIADLETVTARLGYAKESWLFYGKGGFGTGTVNLSALSGPPGAGVTANVANRLYGWTLGAGIEYMAASNIILGLEYNYVDLTGERFTTTDSIGGPFNVDLGNVKINSVLARVIMKLK